MMSYSDIMMTGIREEVTSYGSTPPWGDDTFNNRIAVPATRPWYKWALLHIYVVMAIGLVLNFITLMAYTRSSILQRGKPAQHLIFNIMVSDLLTTVACQPFYIFYYTDVGKKFISNKKYTCIFSASIMIISFEATYFAIMLLTFERLIAIVFPLQHIHRITKKTCQIAILVSWSIVTIKAGIIFFTNSWLPNRNCLMVYLMPEYYAKHVHNPILFGSLGLILLGNIVLGIHISASIKARAALKAEDIKGKQSKVLQDMKMVRILFIVVLCLFLSWIPTNVVSNVVHSQIREGRVNNTALIFLDFSRAWVVAGTVADPLIYIWQNKQCKQAVKELFGKRDMC